MTIELTEKEKQSIRVLNYIAKFDGLISDFDTMKYLIEKGIEKFIPIKRRHLVSLSKNAYPIRIKINKG